MRWAVRVLYTVLTAHEREVKARDESALAHGPRSRRHKTPDHMIHTKRMALALAWIAAFWRTESRSLVRVYYVHPPPSDLAIITDASPWGLGGVLVVIQSGVILEGFSSPLTNQDELELHIKIGDPAGQGVVEMLAIYAGLKLWTRFFRGRTRIPSFLADSLSALGVARKFSSPVPALNHLGSELSLHLEIHDVVDPKLAHVPGKMNDLADFFSRLAAPETPAMPAGLVGVKHREVEGNRGRGYLLPTAAQRPELWVAGGPGEENPPSRPSSAGELA